MQSGIYSTQFFFKIVTVSYKERITISKAKMADLPQDWNSGCHSGFVPVGTHSLILAGKVRRARRCERNGMAGRDILILKCSSSSYLFCSPTNMSQRAATLKKSKFSTLFFTLASSDLSPKPEPHFHCSGIMHKPRTKQQAHSKKRKHHYSPPFPEQPCRCHQPGSGLSRSPLQLVDQSIYRWSKL